MTHPSRSINVLMVLSIALVLASCGSRRQTTDAGNDPNARSASGQSCCVSVEATDPAVNVGAADDDTSPCRSLEDCAISCEQGDVACCMAVGRLHEGNTARTGARKARQTYAPLCEAGDDQACLRLGIVLLRLDEVEHAVPLLQQACNGRGEAEACHSLSQAYAKGLGVSRDDNEARALLERSCQLGWPDACRRRATQLIAEGEDIERGITLLEGMCKQEDARACTTLGRLLSSASAPQLASRSNEQRAFLERGCELGDSDACARLNRIGRCSTLDDCRARCAREDYEACTDQVHFMTKDADRTAVTIDLQNACRAGMGRACFDLANLHISERSPPQTTPADIESYEAACALDYGPGCAAAANYYARGEAVAAELEHAAGLYRSGCDLSDGESCYHLGWLHQREDWNLAKPDESERWFALGCKHGYAAACERASGGRGAPD